MLRRRAFGQSWTKYSYDALGNVVSVTQNAQATGNQQTRSYAYDGLNRLTSETNPESDTTSYTYDSATGTTCSSSSPGNLIKRVDANGNWTCYNYDTLHRVTDVGNNIQSATNACKRFRYDSSSNGVIGIPSGVTVSNVAGRLVEAETDGCTVPITPVTDEWFSYTARGEISDEYQSSPNSSGYYHENLTYWENGVTRQISLLATLPTFTFAVDGEGRVNTISASTGQNPLTGTTYNTASLPTTVNLGSLDSDTFTYDPNTNRETQYQFNVNGQAYSGTLNWNANGTLAGLKITDPFNSADTQECSYQHDDLVRIANVYCSPNQLANPGFESGNVDWTNGSAFSIVNNPANAQSGSWYLSGTSTGDAEDAALINGSQYQPVSAGQVIQFGGWIKRISGTGNMWYSCEIVDTNHNFVAWCPAAGIGDGSGGTSWQFYQQELTIPANGAYAIFYAELHGANDADHSSTTAYFDSAFFGAPSAWSQIFAYDAFGNLTKTVPSGGTGNSFQPTYSLSTNRMTSIAGFTPTYDADGNLTNDNSKTYTWDV
jgi:YD repeat-containing protein